MPPPRKNTAVTWSALSQKNAPNYWKIYKKTPPDHQRPQFIVGAQRGLVTNFNTMPKAYHIKDWENDRENAETRKYAELLWFRNKVKLLGEGLGHTLSQKERQGPFLYGMFKLIEQLAASGRKNERGWLMRNGTPLDAARMGNLMRLPAEFFEEALNFFSTRPMDWLEYTDYTGESPSEKPAATTDRDAAGKTSGESPSEKPAATTDRDAAGKKSATGEHTEEGVQPKKNGREGIHSTALVPSVEDVRNWAKAEQQKDPAAIHPDFAQLKFEQAVERCDFEKKSWRTGWQSKLLRFWREDGSAWLAKFQKNGAAVSAAKLPTDQDWWWTDELTTVEAARSGALRGNDKKTAARLAEIISLRKQK